MRRLFDLLLRLTETRESYLLATLTALVIGLAATEVYRWNMEEDFRERFRDRAWFAASSLEAETMHGLAMGTAMVLGLNEQELKDLALGRKVQDDPDSLRRLQAVRQLLSVDGILVLDNLGDVVAHETPVNRLTGTNIAYRLFWQQAMRGKRVVYPAVGEQALERKLFISAPIHGGATPESDLIGAVAIEMSADYLDYQVGMGGYPALLLSPQGMVFAATERKWLFRVAHTTSQEELDALRQLRQFGSAILGSQAPEVLPFNLNRDVVEFGGASYARATAPVHWNDPSGDWTLVVFGDLPAATTLKQRAVVGVVVALMVMALMELLRRAIHYEAARRDAVAKAEAVADELAAAARQKLQLSEVTISLQPAREPTTLAAVFFWKLASLIPLHQGSLYFIDSVGDDRSRLSLAGCYGTKNAPEHIAVGEGLVGQCAAERQALVFTDVPAGFWRVESGLGEAQPGTLMLFPLSSGKVLLGVLEIASLDAQFASSQAMVESLLPVLSMNLEILLAERLSERNTIAACIQAEEQKARQKDSVDT